MNIVIRDSFFIRYVIELEHGPFRWTVVKQNKDFAVLAARLLTHRAAERIRAPVRR